MNTKETKNKMNTGLVFSINWSKTKGTPKTPVKEAKLIAGLGVEGDAHAGAGDRQISLLSFESIEKQMSCPKIKKGVSLKAGDFAENITTKGLDLSKLKIGDRLKLGSEVMIEVSKIGKECHKYCAIYYKTGDCIMPREGIFAKVLNSGSVKINDKLEVIND